MMDAYLGTVDAGGLPQLEVRGLDASYGAVVAVRGLNLDDAAGLAIRPR